VAREYTTTRDIIGPLLLVERVIDVTYNELVELEYPDGTRSLGNVLEVDGDTALVQAFAGTRGANPAETKVRFLGRALELGVSKDMLGRVFDGLAVRATEGRRSSQMSGALFMASRSTLWPAISPRTSSRPVSPRSMA